MPDVEVRALLKKCAAAYQVLVFQSIDFILCLHFLFANQAEKQRRQGLEAQMKQDKSILDQVFSLCPFHSNQCVC
jgi:hypothetical protein